MENKKRQKKKLSTISFLHYIKLIFRSVLLIAATVFYIIGKTESRDILRNGLKRFPGLLTFIWVFFAVEMILRFFPSNLESMGCQKQFKKNFIPAKNYDEMKDYRGKNGRVIFTAVIWIAFNAVFGALYYAGIIDRGILLLIALAYSVCDMICILFFCPFQTWILKNKCCTNCRIYNWDYAMMFTPLVFMNNLYAWSLVGLSIALLIRWEVTAWRHPERFSPAANERLSCIYCQEKLCSHKKQLRRIMKKQVDKVYPPGEVLRDRRKRSGNL